VPVPFRGWPVALLLVFMAGCRSHSAPPAPVPQATAAIPAFNADQAYGFLKTQCDFGPRPPMLPDKGRWVPCPAHAQCRQFILQQLTPYVDQVKTQIFSVHDSHRNVNLRLTNILGIINPGAKKKIMLFTHWDTRPTADQELDAANKKKPIIGADDGASGTAVLLELARVLHQKKPAVCVELLFVDGEDWGPDDDMMYLGARYFAEHPGPDRPAYAILLDMIGDKDLDIHREINSQDLHPELNDKVWSAAAALGDSAEFPNDVKYQIGDDHLSFNQAGIPAIDLIDFDYPYWHTLQDTADKCSPQSLKIVGDVVAKEIYDEKL
jgi:glutaminyl-peptide cyclotransferase